jgi:hypothetical protein
VTSFPTPWTVDVLPYVGTTEDAYGNETPTWATTPVTRSVYGWGPAGLNETTASRDTVTADLELLAPSDFYVGPKDHVRVLGQTYEVQGGVESYDFGPFGFTPGVRVNLRRFAPS